MSSTVLYMSMSLDGFVTGPNEGPDNGLGDGGERLHEWIFHGTGDHPKEAVGGLGDVSSRVVDEIMSTGAVITGRGTFDAANGWGGDHHDGVPIYVLSRNPANAAQNAPEQASSVALCRVTLYCSGVSILRHSSSDLMPSVYSWEFSP